MDIDLFGPLTSAIFLSLSAGFQKTDWIFFKSQNFFLNIWGCVTVCIQGMDKKLHGKVVWNLNCGIRNAGLVKPGPYVVMDANIMVLVIFHGRQLRPWLTAMSCVARHQYIDTLSPEIR